MSLFSRFVAATAMSVVFLCIAQAMEIRQFDKMAVQDQSEYVGLLVQGAEQVLKDEGRADLAAKVEHLFTTIIPGDAHTIGSVEFEKNLARGRADDAENALKHPNDPRSEVEDVMAITLEKNGIKMPDSFFDVMKDFKPKHPPKKNKN